MNDELPIIDEGTNPFFELQHFLIKINFKINNLRNDDPNAIEDFAQFLHEYTHYLQIVTTTNGISALLSYIDKIIRMGIEIGINIVTKEKQAKEIIGKYKEEFKKFNNQLYWFRKKIHIKVSYTIPKFIVKPIYNPIIKKQSREVFIYNPIDDFFHHVSTTMLRENMALMANFSIRGIGQDAVMDHVKINPSKEKPYSCKYWLLFSYFLYTYPDIKNVVKFTYFFCELALMAITTGMFVEKLLNDIKHMMGKGIYTGERDFFDKLREMNIDKISQDGNLTFELINRIKLTLGKIIDENDFYKPINKLLELAENGLNYKKTRHATIFRNVMDMKWINEMSEMFLSPIIIQPNSDICMLFEDKEYQNLLCILFGVTIVSDKVIKNEAIFCCPFFCEIPICKLTTEEIEDICTSRPFDITVFPSGGCLFYNTALILGLLKDEELEKYIKW